ncbi:MAG: hypothetical protein ThorAB25_10310 [Candidatus Thorarchaeota archaeon AB_25]|nr:MAG: hypothetical protein ThorAB25_10310 [Candidatus Thorarchaeota archaeon AB_25]
MLTDVEDRPRILRAIRKCLVDGDEYFEAAQDSLDEVFKGSVGVGMTPLIGGYAIKDPKSHYRQALISVDSAEKALSPLTKRFKDRRVNESHFTSEKAMVILGDLAGMNYNILIQKLMEQSGRESTWYRLNELREKIAELLELIAEQ